MSYYTRRLLVDLEDVRYLPRKKQKEYKVRYEFNLRNKTKSLIVYLRRNEDYNINIQNENLKETLAFLCCAGIGDKENYKEFYDNVINYPYSQKDYEFHVDVKNKVERLLGGEAELERFINEYTDWLTDN